MKALDYVKIIAATFSVFFFGILLNLPQGIVVFSSIAALFVAVSLHVFHEDQKKREEAAKQAEKQYYMYQYNYNTFFPFVNLFL